MSERAPTTHRLKTWKPYFDDIVQGRKTFEVRRLDRDFRVGDTLELLETEPSGTPYTGREADVLVTYMLPGGTFGIEDGCCVLGIRKDTKQ